MNEEYGVKGCVHSLEQRKIWNIGLDNLINHDSFDVEFSPTGQVQLETKYTHATERYGSTFYVYDEAGKVARAIEFDRSDTETAITEYEYLPGKCLWTRRDAAGIVTRRGVEEYDGTSLTFLGLYDSAGQPIRLKTFEYHSGKLFKAFSKYYGFDGLHNETSISIFDSCGRVVEAFGLTPDGGPTGDGRYKFEYDEEGRTLRILSYNDLVDSKIPNHVRKLTYKCDGRGNWVECIEHSRFSNDSEWRKMKTTRKLTYYPLE